MNTNSSGAFTVTDIPKGTYTLSVKGSRWLRKNVSVSTVNGDVIGLNVGALKGGDANDDNTADVLDLDMLIQSFDLCQNDPGYLAAVDFNNDTCVDVLDMDILIRNFDTSGQAYATRLQASGATGSIVLTWVGSMPDVSGYKVYRAPSAMGTFMEIGTVSNPTMTDSPGVGVFYYKVAALNGSGESVLSNMASATQLPTSLVQVDTAQPGWAEDIIPTDSPAAVGAGPSSATSIDVATGILENRPGADIAAYNSVGASPAFTRLYRSAQAARGISAASPGLTPGWTHNYDLRVTALFPGTWGALELTYPNGAKEIWTPNPMNPTGPLTPQTLGTPYTVSGVASGMTGVWTSLTVMYKDRSKMVFTLSATPNLYRLTQLWNAVGSKVFISYHADGRLDTIQNDATPPQTLLTFGYQSNRLSQVTDNVGSRSVTYDYAVTGGITNLSQVNQVNSSDTLWQYQYQIIDPTGGNWPLLSRVGVVDPTRATTNVVFYPASVPDSIGAINEFYDNNGNKRVYKRSNGYTEVEAYKLNPNSTYTLDLRWQQRFDNAGADTGIQDGKGYTSSVQYTDATNNPKRATKFFNRNGQLVEAEFDMFGNVTRVKTPYKNEILATEYTYSYSDPNFPQGRLDSVREGNFTLNQFKTPTYITYYNGETVDGDVQPVGLIRRIEGPKPGTTNGGTELVVEYVYTALGNVKKVIQPAPNGTPGATVTYELDYTYNPLTNTPNALPEKLGQPTRVICPRDNGNTRSMYYLYDARGNVIYKRDSASGLSGYITEYEYNNADQLKKIIYPPRILNSTTRAYMMLDYDIAGGQLDRIRLFNEKAQAPYDASVAPFQDVHRLFGKEGEFNTLLNNGSALPSAQVYDSLYRVQQFQDGRFLTPTSLVYNEAGQLDRMNYPGNTGGFQDSVQVARDPEGNTLTRTDGEGRTTIIPRDSRDSLPSGVDYPANVTGTRTDIALTRDNYGRVTTIADGVATETYAYDLRRESRMKDCRTLLIRSDSTCRPIGSTLRGRAARQRAV